MRRFVDFRLLGLMVVFGLGGGLYSSFVTALPVLFRHVRFEVIRTWYPFLSILSLGLMFLIPFVMWQVGKGTNLRTELVSTCVSLFLGPWLGRYVGEGCSRAIWLRSVAVFFFLENILWSASSGLMLFFEGFTGVAIGYLTGGEAEESA
jgi:hypothetical protein